MALLTAERQKQLDYFFGRMVELEGRSQETLVFDYTYWDEMVSFVETKDPVWATNVLDTSLNSYDAEYLWVLDPEFNLVYSSAIQGLQNQPLAVPIDRLKEIFINPPFAHFSFLSTDGEAIEIRGASIHPSMDVNHTTLPRGYFFVGRRWDEARLKGLSDLVSGGVTISAVSQTGSGSNQDAIVIDAPLIGIDGLPVAYLKAAFPNRFLQGYRNAQTIDMVVYGLFALFLTGMLLFAIYLWVISPLQRISSSLQHESIQPLAPLLENRSEFGRVARLMVDFFGQKQGMENDILRHEEAEAALRLSEERYRMVSNLASDVAFSIAVGPNGSLQPEWATDSFERLTGRKFEETDNLANLKELVAEEDRPQAAEWIKQLSMGRPSGGDIRILIDGRGKVWLNTHMYPIYDPKARRAVRVYGAMKDITAQKLAEEAYRSLVDGSIQGWAILRGDGVQFANPAIERMTGYTAAEVKAFPLTELQQLVHPNDREYAFTRMEEILSGGEPEDRREIRLQHKNGEWIWVEISASRVDYQGETALQVTLLDISGRKQAQLDLAKEQEYSAVLLDTVDSLVMVIDPQGRVVSTNPVCRRLFGKDENLIRGRYLWDLFELDASSPLAREHFRKLVDQSAPIRGLDLPVRGGTAGTWVSWSHNFMTGADGSPGFVVGTAMDITSRRMRERQQQVVAEIATILRGQPSRREMIDLVMDRLFEFLRADLMIFARPDLDTGDIAVEVVRGEPKAQVEGRRFSGTDSIAADVLSTGMPLICNDLAKEDRLQWKDMAEIFNSAMWLPLIVDRRSLGVVIAGRKEPFTQEECDALTPIADMAANALQRIRLGEESLRRIQHLTALRTINVAIGASLDLRMTLNVLVNQIVSQLGVDAVDVLLLEPNSNTLQYAAGHGFRSKDIEKLRLWMGESQAGRIALERSRRHLHDPNGVAGYFVHSEMLSVEGFVAYDGVPLTVKGEIKGVIETYHRAPYQPAGDWPQFLESLALEAAIAIDNAELLEKLQRKNMELAIAFDATIEGWARAVELRDKETEKHNSRVAETTVRLAQAMGISGDALMHIRRGAILHDIGKIGVRDNILNKQGPLNEDEWKEMRKHPQHAYDMLSPIPFLRPALDIPYCHHEHWDGSGYPRGIAGEEIPLAARIFTVIDVWDALAKRKTPYRPTTWPEEQVLAYLQEQSGRIFDPAMVKAFIDLYPIMMR